MSSEFDDRLDRLADQIGELNAHAKAQLKGLTESLRETVDLEADGRVRHLRLVTDSSELPDDRTAESLPDTRPAPRERRSARVAREWQELLAEHLDHDEGERRHRFHLSLVRAPSGDEAA